MVDHAGQVTVMAPVADLVDADADQPLEPRLIEVVGEDALDDPPDGVPADPEQPGDRRLGHLLGQPRDDVFEVAGVARPRPRPRDPPRTAPRRCDTTAAAARTRRCSGWRPDRGGASA